VGLVDDQHERLRPLGHLGQTLRGGVDDVDQRAMTVQVAVLTGAEDADLVRAQGGVSLQYGAPLAGECLGRHHHCQPQAGGLPGGGGSARQGN